MSKPRSDAIIDGLPENEREQLEAWLFEENISYLEASKRAKADLNISIAPSSLSAWYQRQQQTRMMAQIAASRTNANLVVEKLQQNPGKTYEALTGMIAQLAFDQSMAGKKLDLETLTNLSNLTLSNRSLDLKEQELTLKRDRFQFDAAAECLKKLPTLRAIAAKTGVDQKEKIRQIRLALFGSAPE